MKAVETALDLAAFTRVAATFAAGLREGDVVMIHGELGSGKTAFVRAAVEALQGQDIATSPTFTFRHRYPGPPAVEHLDLYRIEAPAEATELGLDDAFESGAVVMIEWPERLAGRLPVANVEVHIAGSGDGPREITIERPCRA